MGFDGSETSRPIAISVIVPIYNMADKLHTALDSVLAQTLSNIEAVCVNDGSTDGSLSILHDYAETDSRIVVITQDNFGPGPARNAGMNVAKGEYLFFLDPDDLLPSNDVLEGLYQAAKRHGALVAGGNLMQADDNGHSWGVDIRRQFLKEGWMRFSQTEDCFGYTRYIFNREMIVDNQILFPSYRRGQDPVFLIKVMEIVDDFFAITKAVYLYKAGVGHVNWNSEKVCDHYRALIEMLMFSKENDYSHMHSAAFLRVVREDLLVFAFDAAIGEDVRCLAALCDALSRVEPMLLMDKSKYNVFAYRFLVLIDLFFEQTDGSKRNLILYLEQLKMKQRIRKRLVAFARRVNPELSWKLQKKRSGSTGNYGR